MTRNETIENYYRENYDKLVKYARARVGNYSIQLAEDAVQEAFTRALKYFRTYNRDSPFENWFRTILRNAVYFIRNEEQSRGVTSYEELSESTLATKVRSITLSKEIADEFEQLSKRDRDILEAYFFFGLKTREIAEIMPVSHGNVRYIISKFRERLSQ